MLADSADGGNYCHWMLNHLPRLALYERAGVTPGQLLVATSKPAFVERSLRQLGASHRGAVDLGSHPLVSVDELCVVTNVGAGFRHPAHRAAPWALNYLADRFGNGKPESAPSRIYVSREDSDGRRVVNEEHLVGALEERGVKRVTLSGMGVDEQATLFARAEMVVAPHGAGLTNLAFARPGTKVLEMFPDTYGTPAFAMIAGSRALDYATLTGPAVPAYPNRPNRDHIEVDVSMVGAWVDSSHGA